MKDIRTRKLCVSRIIYVLPIIFTFSHSQAQNSLPAWVNSDPCLKSMSNIKYDGNNVYFISNDGDTYNLFSNKTVNGLDGSSGTWECISNRFSISVSRVSNKTNSSSQKSTATFDQKEFENNTNIQKEHNDKRNQLKTPIIIEAIIKRDECKTLIKQLYDNNKSKGSNTLSGDDLESVKRKVCRCILQGESFSDGIWGIGNELKEIKSNPGYFGISRKDYLEPVSNITKGKGKTLLYPDQSIYTGDVDNDIPNGMGVRRFGDGTRYEGNFAGGYFHGLGKLYMEDGTIREGLWYNDKLNGKGKETFKDGTVFEGVFIDDERQFKGVYKYASGSVYEGEFFDGKFDGIGKITFYSGGYYEGEWLNDKRDGTGKYLYPDGKLYEGQFLNDKFNGKGKLKSKEGDLYEGDFYNNEINGNCTIKRINGDYYEGVYDSKTEIGTGTINYTNGEKYSGSWKAHNKDGTGRLISNDGFVYDGSWVKNAKHGKILLYKENDYNNRRELNYINDIPDGGSERIWKDGKLFFSGYPNGQAELFSSSGNYKGLVRNYSPIGYGSWLLTNGTRIEGDFTYDNNIMKGYGKAYATNGLVIEGNFSNFKIEGIVKGRDDKGNMFEAFMKDGNLNGPVTITYPDGTQEKGEYKNGVYVSNSKHTDSSNLSQSTNPKISNGQNSTKFKYISNPTSKCKWCDKTFNCTKKSEFELEFEKQFSTATILGPDFGSKLADTYDKTVGALGQIAASDDKKFQEQLKDWRNNIFHIDLFKCPDYCSPECEYDSKNNRGY